MCLTKIISNECPKTKIGYKLVMRHKSNSGKDYASLFRGDGYHKDKWNLTRKNHMIMTHKGESYLSGFHIYVNKEDAMASARFFGAIIKKVQFNGFVCLGYEGSINQCPVIVARGMKFINRKRRS